MQGFSGGLTGDNIAVEYANVIYAFDESPIKKGVFWAGTNDGLVHVSQDDGKTWNNVTKNIPDLPEYGVVRNIEASKWHVGKAYLTIDFHQEGNFAPYVYKTENFGKSWKKITEGIKEGNLSYTRCIKEDPVKEGLLYLGTENTLYFSFDDGEHWQEMMPNLPHTPMYWIDIQEHFNDLVLGTYGRGIWILDDLSPFQQMDKSIIKKKMHLFDLKSSYRFHSITSSLQMFPEASTGTDPPNGASINYWLQEKQEVEIIILNAENDTIKTIKDKGIKGFNRVWWDFQGESTDDITLRTKPLYAEWVSLDKNRERKVPFKLSIMAPPGTYHVLLKLGEEVMSKKLEVIKDPHSEGTLADIRLQNGLMKKIYDDLNITANYINSMEIARRQLLDLKSILSNTNQKEVLIALVDSLALDFLNLEKKLIQLKATGTGQDDVRFKKMIGEKLAYLGGNVPNADFRPADSYYEVYELLSDRLKEVGVQFEKLKNERVKEVLDVLSEAGVNMIIIE
jgi:hypothetical protein